MSIFTTKFGYRQARARLYLFIKLEVSLTLCSFLLWHICAWSCS